MAINCGKQEVAWQIIPVFICLGVCQLFDDNTEPVSSRFERLKRIIMLVEVIIWYKVFRKQCSIGS